MPVINIAVAGDNWLNRDEVVEKISLCQTNENIVFSINGEGPSLYALGIIDVLERELHKQNVPSNQVEIQAWHNNIEEIPFRRTSKSLLSHFFWMSDDYRYTDWQLDSDCVPLGCFVGRLTLERAVILHYLSNCYSGQVLLSLMGQILHMERIMEAIVAGPEFEIWMQELEYPKQTASSYRNDFLRWWSDAPLSSITDHKITDQYQNNHNTNLDLVKNYGKFRIEIVAETYCLGNTFFPTEKTVRPISQGKPMIVYGPKKFLAGLRKLGFETWGDIWDESYDELDGIARWKAMQTTMGQVIFGKLWNHRLIKPKADLNSEVLNYLVAKYKPQ